LKVSAECALCLFYRGYVETLEATSDPNLRLKTFMKLFDMLAKNFHPNAVPAVIGTMRERIIKHVTGNPDPYAEKKRISNIEAMKFLPLAEKIISSASDAKLRFRKACLMAIVGNIMEFDIPGHVFDFKDLERLLYEAEKDLAIDDVSEAFEIAKNAELIIYLTDNAGEIAFDTLLVKELKNLGGKVIVVVKGKPVYNDATLEDALFVGMDKLADSVITTGTDAIGLILSECSDDFIRVYESADFVVAKGMGNAETITEMNLKVPHLLLLRTKCANVANYFKVARNKNIAKLLYPGKTRC